MSDLWRIRDPENVRLLAMIEDGQVETVSVDTNRLWLSFLEAEAGWNSRTMGNDEVIGLLLAALGLEDDDE